MTWPAPTLQNTGTSHGAALGAEEVAATKARLGLDPSESFAVDPDVLAHARGVVQRGAALHAEWTTAYEQWRSRNPDRAALLDVFRDATEEFAERRVALRVFYS